MAASDDGLDRLRGDIEPEDDRADVGTVTIAARPRIRAFRTCGEFGVTVAGGGDRLWLSPSRHLVTGSAGHQEHGDVPFRGGDCRHCNL